MATSAQIIANQKNAQLSTGPRTADGKSASSRNAIKHGLSSAFRVLAHEDQQEFDQLVEDLRAYHRPRDIHQRLLVDQLAKSQWLLARAQRLQAVAYDLLAGGEDACDPDVAIVKAMRAANPDVIGRFERYAASAERSFYKAYRELSKQKEANAARAIEAELAEYRAAAHPGPVQNEPNLPGGGAGLQTASRPAPGVHARLRPTSEDAENGVSHPISREVSTSSHERTRAKLVSVPVLQQPARLG